MNLQLEFFVGFLLGLLGSLEPLLSHLFEFHQFLPLDRSDRKEGSLTCMLIIYNFNNRKNYQFYKHFIFIRIYLTYDLNLQISVL